MLLKNVVEKCWKMPTAFAARARHLRQTLSKKASKIGPKQISEQTVEPKWSQKSSKSGPKIEQKRSKSEPKVAQSAPESVYLDLFFSTTVIASLRSSMSQFSVLSCDSRSFCAWATSSGRPSLGITSNLSENIGKSQATGCAHRWRASNRAKSCLKASTLSFTSLHPEHARTQQATSAQIPRGAGFRGR